MRRFITFHDILSGNSSLAIDRFLPRVGHVADSADRFYKDLIGKKGLSHVSLFNQANCLEQSGILASGRGTICQWLIDSSISSFILSSANSTRSSSDNSISPSEYGSNRDENSLTRCSRMSICSSGFISNRRLNV